jgi:hypothetical protein
MASSRIASVLRIGAALALLGVLAACTKGGQFDPSEVFSSDMFETKKKLQGDRVPLFPNGVPGAATGVPPDLVKGYQPPPEQADAAPGPAAAPEPAKPKPKPKPKLAAAPAQQPPQAPQPQQTQQPQAQDPVWNQPSAPVATGPKRISVGSSSQSAPPQQQAATPAQAPWPATPGAQPAPTNWPAPPPTGGSSQ